MDKTLYVDGFEVSSKEISSVLTDILDSVIIVSMANNYVKYDIKNAKYKVSKTGVALVCQYLVECCTDDWLYYHAEIKVAEGTTEGLTESEVYYKITKGVEDFKYDLQYLKNLWFRLCYEMVIENKRVIVVEWI